MTRRLAIFGVAAIALSSTAAIHGQQMRPAPAGQQPPMTQMHHGQQDQHGQHGQPQGHGTGVQHGQGMGPGAMMRRGGPGGPNGAGRPGQPGQPGGGMALRGLKLSDAQKAQVKAIREKAQADVEAVMTPEQRETLKTRRQGRGRGGK